MSKKNEDVRATSGLTPLVRLSMTEKMALLTIMVGIAVWIVTDRFQARGLESIFQAQLLERLGEQSVEDRIRFDHYIKAHYHTAKLFVALDSFTEHIKTKKWHEDDTVEVKRFRGLPPWLPPGSVLRALAQPRIILLLDPGGRVREIYQTQRETLPPSLLQPTPLLLSKSHGQSFLTKLDGIPYLMTAEPSFGAITNLLATLVLASPIDDEFLIASQGFYSPKLLLALVIESEHRILTSSNIEELPPGYTLDKIQDRYLIAGQGFFDYGASELEIRLASFISLDKVDAMTRSALSKARKRRALMALAFILSFTFIMYLVTRRIRQLTRHVVDFEEKELGVQLPDIQRGDELKALRGHFHNLTDEVLKAREIIRREAEEQTRVIVNNAFDAIIAVDSDARVITWNPGAETLFGWSMDEAVKQTLLETIIPPQYHEAHQKGFEHFLKTGEGPILDKIMEFPARHRDGHEFPVEIHITCAESKGKFTFIAFIHDITERKKALEQIEASLKEKEMLLREVHHRVKNNMQVISSLLRLQSGLVKDEKYIEMFRESQDRIKSMALIHERLYRSEDLARVEFEEYVKDLTSGLIMSYGVNLDRITIKLDIRNIFLSIDSAIPCGLIINELVSNSLKHAFPDGVSGELVITVRSIGKDEFELAVSDNGVGLPEGLDYRKTETLGLQLITTLAEDQLHGTMSLRRTGGTEFKIRFRTFEYKKRI